MSCQRQLLSLTAFSLVPWTKPFTPVSQSHQQTRVLQARKRYIDERYQGQEEEDPFFNPKKKSSDNNDDDGDDDIFFDTRTFSESPEAEKLRNMRFEEDEEDRSDVKGSLAWLRQQKARNDRYFDGDEEEEEDGFFDRNERDQRYYDDDDAYGDDYFDEEDDDDGVGNYWSNPQPGLDSVYPRTGSRSRQESSSRPPRRQRRKTTFRSGKPVPPKVATDFYEKFFLVGLDGILDSPVETDYKTLFGGTRGKFDGLGFMEDAGIIEPSPKRRSKRTPRSRELRNDNNDFFDEDYEDEGGYEDDEYTENPPRQKRPPQEKVFEDEDDDDNRPNTSSNDAPRPRRPHRSQARQPKMDFDNEYDDEQVLSRRRSSRRRRGGGDWAAKEVSSWFTDKPVDDKGPPRRPRSSKNEIIARRRERQRDQNPLSSSISNFFEDLFNVGDDDDDYDDDFVEPRTQRQRKNQRRSQDFDDDWDLSGEWEEDSDIDEDVFDNSRNDNVLDAEIEDRSEFGEEQSPKREREWETVKSQYERVPPADVPAWGPSGELGIDARTKAALDAFEDIQQAKNRLELKKQRTAEAIEDLVILRADRAIEKKRAGRGGDSRRAVERLRQLELDIENASLEVRRAKASEEFAGTLLKRLEIKHLALLSLYDTDKLTLEDLSSSTADSTGENDQSDDPSPEETNVEEVSGMNNDLQDSPSTEPISAEDEVTGGGHNDESDGLGANSTNENE